MNSNLRSISRSFMGGIKSAQSSVTTLSTDKNVLYIMLIIAVVNVMGYLMMGNFEAVVFFAIVAYLSTFFTKNMVYVFLIAILATNFLMVSKVNYLRGAGREGMENKDATTTAPTTTDPSPTPSSAPTTDPTTKPTPKPTMKASKKTSGEKEGMNGRLAPAKFNNTNDDTEDDDSTPFPSSKAQETRNVENAHDNLQSIGGLQTEKVMQQQKILMDNMKTMQPFLETAERFLDKFNMKGIDGLLGKIGLGSGQSSSATPSSATPSRATS
jgi:hypothetical protein